MKTLIEKVWGTGPIEWKDPAISDMKAGMQNIVGMCLIGGIIYGLTQIPWNG